MKYQRFTLAAALVLSMIGMSPAHADKLDDIIASGKLKCGVTLDFPPMGSRDAKNNPIGFDVDMCHDLGKALGAEVEIIETPQPVRIPSLVSGRTDVGVSNVSDTLERAKTVGFSIPYFAMDIILLTKDGSGIDTFDQLKGRRVGGVAGNYETVELENHVKQWGDPKGSFRAYQSMADMYLAVQQGQVDAGVTANANAAAAIATGKYPGMKMGGRMPVPTDLTTIIVPRQEQGLLNYINLFINQQIRTGRYHELYKKWLGSDTIPNLTVPGVYR